MKLYIIKISLHKQKVILTFLMNNNNKINTINRYIYQQIYKIFLFNHNKIVQIFNNNNKKAKNNINIIYKIINKILCR